MTVPGRYRQFDGLKTCRSIVPSIRSSPGASSDPRSARRIEQVAAVAHHARVLQGAGESALVGLGQEAARPPALHDAPGDPGVLLMQRGLQLGHRHQHLLVGARRQLRQHFGLAAADEDRRQRLADAIEPDVADDAPGVIALGVLVHQLPGGAEAVLIDELDDRDQLLELVLQRCAGEHDHPRLAPREARDLSLPLVLERGRADHQHPTHAEMAGEDLGGGDRLDVPYTRDRASIASFAM